MTSNEKDLEADLLALLADIEFLQWKEDVYGNFVFIGEISTFLLNESQCVVITCSPSLHQYLGRGGSLNVASLLRYSLCIQFVMMEKPTILRNAPRHNDQVFSHTALRRLQQYKLRLLRREEKSTTYTIQDIPHPPNVIMLHSHNTSEDTVEYDDSTTLDVMIAKWKTIIWMER